MDYQPIPEGKTYEEMFNEQFAKASKTFNERFANHCKENGLDVKEEIKKMYAFMNENPYYLSQGTLGK